MTINTPAALLSRRVCVIGAGPSGLSVLSALNANEGGFEVVGFEKQQDWGGLWNYSHCTGVDQNGEPQHASMYRYLFSNGPKECLEFPDYSFEEHLGHPTPSFPPRAFLRDYIEGRAIKADIRSLIRFNCSVKWLTYDQESAKFIVSVLDHDHDKIETHSFDNVIICTGHFSSPNQPFFEGITSFAGRVLHSHDVRNVAEFKDLRVLVVGSGYSGEDVALQSFKYGAKSVIISHRTKQLNFKWPSCISEKNLLHRVAGNQVFFADGSSAEVDVIVLCTGYRHVFPFIGDDSLRLKTDNVLYPPDLYKGVVWNSNPNLFYVGMQDQFWTFSMFQAQAMFVRDCITGHVKIPESIAERQDDIAKWRSRQGTLESDADMIDFQSDYVRDLCENLHEKIPKDRFDIDLVQSQFKAWEHSKDHNILTYRDEVYVSPVTHTRSVKPTKSWIDEFDDSATNFSR